MVTAKRSRCMLKQTLFIKIFGKVKTLLKWYAGQGSILVKLATYHMCLSVFAGFFAM